MLFWAGAIAATLAYWPLVRRPPSVWRSVLKTLSVACLAAVAGQAGQPVLALALAFCALGDLMLSRAGEAAFMAGVGAFALGHLAYLALFLVQPLSDPGLLLALPQVAGLAVLALLGAAMARLILPRAGNLRIPVALYIPIILAMGLAALTLGQPLVVLAAALFILSDSVLALETFVIPQDNPAHRWLGPAVWPLYWGAQALFVIALIP